ncbi:MAG: cadherin domain-containing protein [Chloroflexota bacterium]
MSTKHIDMVLQKKHPAHSIQETTATCIGLSSSTAPAFSHRFAHWTNQRATQSIVFSLCLAVLFALVGTINTAYAAPPDLTLSPQQPITVPVGANLGALSADTYYIDGDVSTVDVVVNLDDGGNEVGSIDFTLDYNNECLSLNDPDTDVVFNPTINWVTTGVTDTGANGIQAIMATDFLTGFGVVHSIDTGSIMTVTFGVNSCRTNTTDGVGIGATEAVTLTFTNTEYGSNNAMSIAGTGTNKPFDLRFNATPIDIATIPMTVAENIVFTSTLSTTDHDSDINDTQHTYALVTTCANAADSADNGTFTLTGALSNTLQASSAFDYETKNSYNICVQTTDWEGFIYTETFAISVNDVNEVPTDISLSGSHTITENLGLLEAIGQFTTTDQDTGDSHSYSLVDGATSAFTVTGSTLQTNQGFDFETQSSYTVTVRTTDSGSLTYDETFTITVIDAPDAPTDLVLSSTQITENLPISTTIGTFSTTDQDAGDSFTYTMIDGATSAFTITGDTLYSNMMFDFETQSTYTLTVETRDSTNLTYSEVVTISIIDVNEGPTDMMLNGSHTITENQPALTNIGVFTTTDVDAGDTFTYTLVDGATSAFTIAGDTLQSSQVFDFETQSSYTITVQTMDSGNLTYSETFTITVLDDPDAPTDLMLLGTGTITENLPALTNIGTLTTTDQDAGDTFTYTLEAGATSAFSISGNSLVSNQSFDFETQSVYTVAVRTTDSSNLSYTETVTVTILDDGGVPTDVSLNGSHAITENLSINTNIGQLTTTHQDSSQSFTYTLVDGATSAFNISGDLLRSSMMFNFEAQNSYTVTVRSSDSGSPSLTFDKVFTITVVDVNEAPVPVDDIEMTFQGQAIAIAALANDSDLDVDMEESDSDPGAETIAIVGVTQPASGTVAFNSTVITYTPDAAGIFTFSYDVSDNATTPLTNTGTITVTVVEAGVNDNTIITDTNSGSDNVFVFTFSSGALARSVMAFEKTTALVIPDEAIDDSYGPMNLVYQENETGMSTNAAPTGYDFAGRVFEMDLYLQENGAWQVQDGFVFSSPVTITLNYNDADLVNVDEETMTLWYWDTGMSQWSTNGITITSRDGISNVIVATLAHFTEFALMAQESPVLGLSDVPGELFGKQGMTMTVPVSLTTKGGSYAGADFSLTFDNFCLSLDEAATTSHVSVTHMLEHLGGSNRVDVTVDAGAGVLTDTAALVNLVFNVDTLITCTNKESPMTATTGVTPVFTNTASVQSNTGIVTVTGKVDDGDMAFIANDTPGDCNHDGSINAGDLPAVIIESFDAGSNVPGDGTLGGPEFWLYSFRDNFVGSPLGCDASPESNLSYNASPVSKVDIADLTCLVSILFGNNSCTMPAVAAAAVKRGPTVAPAAPNAQLVNIPVHLQSDGNSVVSAAFTLEFEPGTFGYREATFNVPAGMTPQVDYDADNGRVTVVMYTFALQMPTMADGMVATISLQTSADMTVDPEAIRLVDASLGAADGSGVAMDVNGANLQLGTFEYTEVVDSHWVFMPVVLK